MQPKKKKKCRRRKLNGRRCRREKRISLIDRRRGPPLLPLLQPRYRRRRVCGLSDRACTGRNKRYDRTILSTAVFFLIYPLFWYLLFSPQLVYTRSPTTVNDKTTINNTHGKSNNTRAGPRFCGIRDKITFYFATLSFLFINRLFLKIDAF